MRRNPRRRQRGGELSARSGDSRASRSARASGGHLVVPPLGRRITGQASRSRDYPAGGREAAQVNIRDGG